MNFRISGALSYNSYESPNKETLYIMTWYCLDESHNPTAEFSVVLKPYSLTDKQILFTTTSYDELISWLNNY